MNTKEMTDRIAELEKENAKLKKLLPPPWFALWSEKMENIIPRPTSKYARMSDFADISSLPIIVRKYCFAPPYSWSDYRSGIGVRMREDEYPRYEEIMCEILSVLKKYEYKKDKE